jgi:hypothetical protein
VLIGFVGGLIDFVSSDIGLLAILAVYLLYCTIIHSLVLACWAFPAVNTQLLDAGFEGVTKGLLAVFRAAGVA